MTSANAPLILPLAEARENSFAGGKAVNLGELLRAGFPVPDGFVVTTTGFHAARSGEVEHVLAEVTAAYRALFEGNSGAVAVRSSATAEDMAGASMAGQYDTFLNIESETALTDAVRACWASIDSPRTRAYLQQNGIPLEKVAMAVVVQKLVPAEIAGVMFTVNPHTGSRDEMLIEAAWGLGEAVVSGMVQPDVLRIRTADGGVIEQIVADKQIMIPPGAKNSDGHGEVAVEENRRRVACLEADHVRQLHALAQRAAAHFGKPQDIEWAVAGGKVYQLQSRPITTLENVEAYYEVLSSERTRLKKLMAQGQGPWALHNLGETLPHPTPLTWDVMKWFMSGNGGFGAMYRAAGFDPSAEVRRDGFLELIAGRVYMDTPRSPEMFFKRYPFKYDIEALRTNPEASQAPPTIACGTLLDKIRAGRRIGRSNRLLHKLAETHDKKIEQQIPKWIKFCKQEAAHDLTTLDDESLREMWAERIAETLGDWAGTLLMPSLISGVLMEDLKAFLAERFWDRDTNELATTLSSPVEADKTVQANAALYRVAHGAMTVKAWLEEFGHRAPNEFDLSTPRWRERPAELAAMAARLRDGPDPLAQHMAHVQKVMEVEKELSRTMSSAESGRFARLVKLCRRHMRYREDGKYYMMMGYELMRQAALEVGRRWAGKILDARDDVFYLTDDEIQPALAGMGNGREFKALVAQRRRIYDAEARITLPRVIDAGDIDSLGNPAAHIDKNAARYEAFALSTGSAQGPVRIVRDPAKAAELGSGYILVCNSTDPAWTPLFISAAGLVLECGGTLSHGAVVAREMGIPAVVLPDATRLFSEGEQVTVDGHGGAIYRAAAGDKTLDYAASKSPRAAESTSTKIDPLRMPPPPGDVERRGRKIRTWSLIVWGAFLVAAFALPAAMLYEPCLRILDTALWPLVRLLGRPGAVAVIAALMAVGTMAAQYLLTDVKRLREAKKRAAILNQEAATHPRTSPRFAALRAAAGSVQARIMGATIVPLALLLGPMVMIFMWLPARVEPINASAAAGSDVKIVIEINSDYRGEIVCTPPAGFTIKSAPEGIRRIRETLTALLNDPVKLAAATQGRENIPADPKADLEKYLKQLPPQKLTWDLGADEASADGLFEARLICDGANIAVPFIIGERVAPRTFERDGQGPIKSVDVKPTKPPAKLIFFTPLSQFGVFWDLGLWGVYLIVYVPVMLAVKFALRLP